MEQQLNQTTQQPVNKANPVWDFWKRIFTKIKFKWVFIYLGGLIILSVIAFYLVCLLTPLPTPPVLAASEVYDINNILVATFYDENRRPVELEEVPLFLKQAFLALEDHRFYEHNGVNFGRIFKAAWHNLLHRRIEQGGSTITQQLAKNVYLSNERKLSRKLRELYYTIKLEMRLTKDEIFELYLNQICFGHAAYGVKVAADIYFDKELSELNEAEMALLAGLPRWPAHYSPYKNPKAARERLKQTLRRMVECKYITEEQYEIYSKQELNLPGLKTYKAAPYFMDLIKREIATIFPDDSEIMLTAGWRIESTIDLELQKAANDAFEQGLSKLVKIKDGIPYHPQGAFVAIDPSNGEIRALIGGTDFAKSQFNRAFQAKRQPGSAFKPILYATALKGSFSLASAFELEPKTYIVNGRRYCPTDGRKKDVYGKITLRDALARSSNVVAVRLIEQVGASNVVALAEKLGIKSGLQANLSLALGTSEVTPVELVTAYIPFANGGIAYEPRVIRRIIDSYGNVLYENQSQEGVRVLDSKVAYLVTDALRGVLRSGGTAANIGHKINRPAAGKTGTTNKNRDAWFVGYTPDLVAGVYVGYDQNERTLPNTANRVAAPIWADFMVAAFKGKPVKQFRKPANLISATVCTESGMLPINGCPTRSELFIKGTEPIDECEEHLPIDIKVCSVTGKLPGPHCRQAQRTMISKDVPTETCTTCVPQLIKEDERPKESVPNEDGDGKKKGGLKNIFRRIFGKKKD